MAHSAIHLSLRNNFGSDGQFIPCLASEPCRPRLGRQRGIGHEVRLDVGCPLHFLPVVAIVYLGL